MSLYCLLLLFSCYTGTSGVLKRFQPVLGLWVVRWLFVGWTCCVVTVGLYPWDDGWHIWWLGLIVTLKLCFGENCRSDERMTFIPSACVSLFATSFWLLVCVCCISGSYTWKWLCINELSTRLLAQVVGETWRRRERCFIHATLCTPGPKTGVNVKWHLVKKK